MVEKDDIALNVFGEPLDVGFDVQGTKPGYRHFLDATYQMVIDVVVYFVDGTANEVVGTKDTKLVLNFVVVVAEVSCNAPAAQHGIDASVFFLVDEKFRCCLVDVHHSVRHEAT